MSYARLDEDSDVYVFDHVDGWYECHWCDLKPNTLSAFQADDAEGMVAHLLEHRAAGHKVPQYAIDELRDEIRA